MSKYQPKIYINNPAKTVPDSIVEQFFLSIKTGDLDKIRNFVNENNNKFNLTENMSKDGNNPFHIVLELNDKIADTNKKLEIMNYLASMGSPMDLPNKNNVWPIHLAAKLQSAKIVDFFTKHGVSINRLDSSNNTPLHYAIKGKQLDSCPSVPSVKDLNPPQKIEKINLNKSLSDVNNRLIKIISENKKFNRNLIHIVNTITKIPEMYENEPFETELKKEVYTMFTDVATNPNLPTGADSIMPYRAVSEQAAGMEQIIDKAYSLISEGLLKGVTNEIDAAPGNTGWGPTYLTNPPSNLHKILAKTTDDMQNDVIVEKDKFKSKITDEYNFKTSVVLTKTLPDISNKMERNLLTLAYCVGCKGSVSYGENFVKTIAFFYLTLQNHCRTYRNMFVKNILDVMPLFNAGIYQQQVQNFSRTAFNPANPIDLAKQFQRPIADWPGQFTQDSNDILYECRFYKILDNYNTLSGEKRSYIECAMYQIYSDASFFNTSVGNYFRTELKRFFVPSDSNNDGVIPHNELKSLLGKTKVSGSDKSLLSNPRYKKYQEYFDKMDKTYKNKDNTWFSILNIFLRNLHRDFVDRVGFDLNEFIINNLIPIAGFNFDDILSIAIFPSDMRDNIYSGWVNHLEKYRYIPTTPFSFIYGGVGGQGLYYNGDRNSYTFLEIFQLLNSILRIMTGNVNIGLFYNIQAFMRQPVNTWEDEIESFGNLHPRPFSADPLAHDPDDPTIEQVYPEFIFLYLVFAERVKSVIEIILGENYDLAIELVGKQNYTIAEPDDPLYEVEREIRLIRLLHNGFTRLDVFSALLPTDFNHQDDQSQQYKLMQTKLDDINNLVSEYQKFSDANPLLRESITRIYFGKNINIVNDAQMRNNLHNYDYTDVDKMKLVINKLYSKYKPNLVPVLSTPEFSRLANLVFSAPENNIIRNILANFVTTKNPLGNIRNLIKFQTDYVPESLLIEFFINAIYFFKSGILEIVTNNVNRLNQILNLIPLLIKNDLVYYVPQILLPSFIRGLIHIHNIFQSVNNKFKNIDNNKDSILTHLKTKKDANVINMTHLIEDFFAEIKKNLDRMYTDLMSSIKYHNEVIEYINFLNAANLFNSKIDPATSEVTVKDGVFDKKLALIDEIEIKLDDTTIDKKIEQIIENYKISEIIYYAPKQIIKKIEAFIKKNGIFFVDHNNTLIPDGERIKYNYYDVGNFKYIDYNELKPDDRINIDFTKTSTDLTYSGDKAVNTLSINIDKHTKHRGNWLSYDSDTKNIKFDDANIGFKKKNYKFNWLNGAPSTIKQLLSNHLLIQKQKIIEELIQKIVNNKHPIALLAGLPPNKNLLEIYNNLMKLGNENTFTEMNEVKVTVIIAKLLDKIINNVIDYAIKMSISSWILSFAKTDSKFKSIVDLVKKQIDIIKNSDYLKISANSYDSDSIEKLLIKNSNYVDIELPQVENNIENIKYITNQYDDKFVHHLYNINYFSSSNTNTNNKCYKIVPAIANKLIDSFNINTRNSDGNTPLHIALSMKHSTLVQDLINRGAITKDFKNLQGKTPFDFGLDLISEHLNFTKGDFVNNTIDNFVVNFNNLLIARLRDEKFNNNIIKNITFGIPIQIIAYNHMFSLYLENYRYGFDANIKASLNSIIKKHSGSELNKFPIDLFLINPSKILNIISYEYEATRINKVYDIGNSKKIKKNKKEIDKIDIQINGLEEELKITANDDQKKALSDLIAVLKTEKSVIETKTKSLIPNIKNVDIDTLKTYAIVYENTISHLEKNISRNINVDQFYRDAFSNIGTSTELYIKIWENYINKDLNEAPSMIFSHLSKIIDIIIQRTQNNSINVKDKQELATIVNFFNKVKEYIESKDPKGDTDDNPELANEINIIKYIINLILTPATRNILLEQIYIGIKSMDITANIVQNYSDVLDNILNIVFNGRTLDEFLTDVLPNITIKYFALTFKSKDDPDKMIASASDLFIPIIEIIKFNTLIKIDDDSTVIKNLKEYTIPFLSNTYQQFIHHLRLAIYGYERYILNTCESVKILNILINS